MAVSTLAVWKDTLNKLPKVNNNSWAKNFAKWYADRVLKIAPKPANFVPVAFSFKFAQPVLVAELMKLQPVSSSKTGITNFANAWEKAVKATIVTTGPGSYKPPPLPANTFSVVNSVIITPASIAKGKAKIMELVKAPMVNNALNSKFAPIFRDATLLLTITVTGLDSTTPDNGGPLPLTVANIPLI